MTRNKKQTFLQGALILVCANILVKIIGAVFKIPLANLIRSDGMGLFGYSYGIYTVMFIVATAGFPIAISKMVSESYALNNYREGDRIFKIALSMLIVIGVLGSAALYFGADIISKTLKNERAALGIMAISPAVLCVSIISAFRGYFQGRQNMYPTAISEVIEAFGKLIIGYFLASYFISSSIDLASAGAAFGVSCGTFLAMLFLIIIYSLKKNNSYDKKNSQTRSYRVLAKKLILIAVPITIGASVASLTNLADMFTVNLRLQSITMVTSEFIEKYSLFLGPNFTGAIDATLSNKLYGLYSGFVVPLFSMPLTIVVALAMSVVPAVSSALAKANNFEAVKITKSAIRITTLFALPCAIGMSVLSAPILKLVYMLSASEAVLGAKLLSEISIAIIFVSLLQITTAILQSYGKVNIPVINMLIGGIIKVIINYVLVAIPSINIEGAPIGTNICYFIIVSVNMYFIIRETKIKFEIQEFVIKPLICVGAMGISLYFIYNYTMNLIKNNAMSTLISISCGGLVYLIMMFVTGAIKKDDIEMLPKGKLLAEKLTALHMIK